MKSVQEMKSANGAGLSRATRWRLAKQAFALTAAYDSAIANTLDQIAEAPAPEAVAELDTESLPKTLRINMPMAQPLRYGENPHQRAALYADGSGLGIAGAKQLQGKELSFNNLVDLDACWELAQEFPSAESDPAVVAIVKHTNPCGAATGATVLEAYQKALAADPVSAFGGVIGINREVDATAANEIAKLSPLLPLPKRPVSALPPRRIFASLKFIPPLSVPSSSTFQADCYYRTPTPPASPNPSWT
jgi:phosphoribosylaminoimidazolecarboxamide formyltransferase/IMP cyclohydrolase